MSNISLTALAREQLELALVATSGRSAHTVHGGRNHLLRETVIALAAGQSLAEHSNPGEATVQVCCTVGSPSRPPKTAGRARRAI